MTFPLNEIVAENYNKKQRAFTIFSMLSNDPKYLEDNIKDANEALRLKLQRQQIV